MPVTIEEINKCEVQITWKTDITCPCKRQINIPLQSVQPNTSYGFRCEAKRLEPDHEYSNTKFIMTCVLFVKPNMFIIGDDPDRKPTASWVTINQEEKRHFLKEGIKNWTTEDLVCQLDEPGDWEDIPFTFDVVIQFPTSNRGESRVAKKLSDVFVHQLDCDVQFLLEGSEIIGGHTNILSTMSPAFASMFKTKTNKNQSSQVVVNGVQGDVFKNLLRYVYSGRLWQALTIDTAQKLFLAALKFDIIELQEDCIDYIETQIEVNNALELMSWSHRFSIYKLQEATLNFIATHSKEIYKQDSWGQFIRNEPNMCLIVTRHVMEMN